LIRKYGVSLLLFENLFIAIKSLKSNPLRSILTLIGMAVGIAAVIYVVTLGQITQQRVKSQLEALGSNILLIRPGSSQRHGVRTNTEVVNLQISDAEEIEKTSPAIIHAVPIISSRANVEFRDKNTNINIDGVPPIHLRINNNSLVEGRFFNEAEMSQRSRVCVLGSTASQQLFENHSPVGESVLINGKRFEVIGLLAAKGEGWYSPDEEVFVPLTTARERLFGRDNLSYIQAQMGSAADFDEALFDIETILRRNHRLRPDQENDFSVRRQDFFLSTIQDTNKEIADFIILIALISLLVGGIGIANVMLVAVTERTREIGIRRAIGAKKIAIILQFLTEAVSLGILGGIIGLGSGMIFNYLKLGNHLFFPWLWVFYSFMICAGIGILAGIYPAIRAANANVIDSLRYE
jgi:putative ABC transport system permease protein